MRACHVCSGELAPSARFCPSCGAANALSGRPLFTGSLLDV